MQFSNIFAVMPLYWASHSCMRTRLWTHYIRNINEQQVKSNTLHFNLPALTSNTECLRPHKLFTHAQNPLQEMSHWRLWSDKVNSFPSWQHSEPSSPPSYQLVYVTTIWNFLDAGLPFIYLVSNTANCQCTGESGTGKPAAEVLRVRELKASLHL